MNMKRKYFTSKKELKDGKRLDTGRKRMNKNTVKRLSFDNKGTLVCFVTSSLDTWYYFYTITFYIQYYFLPLNFSWFLRYIVLNLFLFFSEFF